MYVTAQINSKDLPALSLGDDSVENCGWRWQDGWCGLVPGEHELSDALAILGKISGESELANGKTYDFLEGKVRVSILDGAEEIAKIFIDKLSPEPFNIPPTINEAMELYGKLITTGVSRLEGAILERPGMRICCDAMQEHNPILWMEIYCPSS